MAKDKINNLEYFKQMVLEDLNSNLNVNTGNVAELSKDLINNFVRDNNQDIIYNSKNPDSTLKNFPFFCFVDCKDILFISYNKNNVDEKIINNFKYKEEYGCLYFVSNTDRSYNVNVKNTQELDTFHILNAKSWYCNDNLVKCY